MPRTTCRYNWGNLVGGEVKAKPPADDVLGDVCSILLELRSPPGRLLNRQRNA